MPRLFVAYVARRSSSTRHSGIVTRRLPSLGIDQAEQMRISKRVGPALVNQSSSGDEARRPIVEQGAGPTTRSV